MTGLPLAPAMAADVIGAPFVAIVSFLSVRYAYRLIKMEPKNFLWDFLFYFCVAMAAFAISRCVGHMVHLFVVFSGKEPEWNILPPLSGGINTLLIISAASVVLYYHKWLEAYEATQREINKQKAANAKLAETAEKFHEMNTNLEEIVNKRTHDLSVSEKKFRHFFENSKDMVYFCSDGGQVSDINHSGLRMLGYQEPPDDFNLHTFFKNVDELHQYLEALYNDGFVSDFEIEMVRQDGSLCHVLLSANSILNDQGEMVGCEGVAKDMTRLKTITEQLISQRKMVSIGQLAAGVAHEINTPLGIILGYAQLMKDDYQEESEPFQNLSIVERQTKVCQKIVADLLKFSRQTVSEKIHLQINDVLEDVFSVTEHFLNMDHIGLTRKLNVDLPLISGDPEKLRQVFLNLINNAHHAISANGTITVYTSYSQKDRRVVCTVTDTGTGVAPDIQDKIFDPFFTTKGVGQGTGLGLSVTYGIINDHDASITLESPASSEGGTSFHIYFPILNTKELVQ